MNFLLPVYVEQRKSEGSSEPLFVVRPVFHSEPEARAASLSRALARLQGKLVGHVQSLARKGDHRELAEFVFAPATTERTLDLGIEVRKETIQGRFLFVEFNALGRRVAFTPQLPRAWFTVERGQSLRDRAEEFLAAYLRRRDPDHAGADARATARAAEVLAPLQGKAWVTALDVSVSATQDLKPPPASFFAFLNESEKPDGMAELQRVGRCLNLLYPDELDRALFRDEELGVLSRLLEDTEKRPVLLLGPHGVGKTALIHEYVHRTAASAQSGQSRAKREVWLLSPQRLISGMSYVGQWENRLLAIIDVARRRHVLYFDDLLGLFHAGVTWQTATSVAHVLKPYLERREVRVLAEITPEALRVLQEVDRGFAELFHILPLREPSADQTLRILIRLVQYLEAQHQTRFAADVLPAAMDLQRRYVRDVVFPGKAAALLKQLAVRFKTGDVTREKTLQEYHAKTGVNIGILDDRQKLLREEVRAGISRRIIGQAEAVEAMADAVCLAKARLNDPQRPLATFLFLGPTGVGKTQCAKALAEYLFGSAERLLRFDLNEYVDPDAVAKLTGTLRDPDGLLTSAIRRQPFSVLLFDEVEKADPAVFDLLLQVLGEGRLTDARGRTADFTNAIIILTSNLGVREASAVAGLKSIRAAPGDASIYRNAAEKFFRPEFFNRLDRVIPFGWLGRDEIRRIAELLLQDVLKREGLVRRRCVLQVHPAAMERVVDQGYHPTLGARALKRAIERQLAQPVAAHLAGWRPDVPTVISLYPAGPGIAVHVQPLTHASPCTGAASALDALEPRLALERLARALARIEAAAQTRRPHGAVSTASLRPEHHVYFAMRDEIRRVRLWIDRTRESLQPRKGVRLVRRRPGRAHRPETMRILDVKAHWAALFALEDVRGLCEDRAGGAPAAAQHVRNISRHVSLLQAMLADGFARVLLLVRANDASAATECAALLDRYEAAFTALPGVEVSGKALTPAGMGSLVLHGPHALAVSQAEVGTHLFVSREQSFKPVQVAALSLDSGVEAAGVLAGCAERREQWLADVALGKASVDDDPFPLAPVVRVYQDQGSIVDVRSGQVVPGPLTVAQLYDLILDRLPPVDELLNAE